MKAGYAFMLLLLLGGALAAAEQPPAFEAKPIAVKAGGAVRIEFAADRERPARRGQAVVVLAVPDECLLQRARLQRPGGVLPQHAGRQVPDDRPARVLNVNSHVGLAVRREPDLNAIGNPGGRGLAREPGCVGLGGL